MHACLTPTRKSERHPHDATLVARATYLSPKPSALLQDEAGAAAAPGDLGEDWHARLRAVTQGLHGLAASHLSEQAYSAAVTEQLEHRMQVWLDWAGSLLFRDLVRIVPRKASAIAACDLCRVCYGA